MQTAGNSSSPNTRTEADSPHQANFRDRFQQAVQRCVRRGFPVEECFEFVWEETLEAFTLNRDEQQKLRRELKFWANRFRA